MIYLFLVTRLSFVNTNQKRGFVVVFFTVWFMIRNWGSVILWLTGSCNYLWGTATILLFIYSFYHKTKFTFRGKSVVWLLFGIIAGWFNENVSGMSILVCCLFLLYYGFAEKEKIRLWQISGIAGNVIGFAVLILSPGNTIRAAELGVSDNIIFQLHRGFVYANGKAFTAGGKYGILFFIFVFSFFTMLMVHAEKKKKYIGSIWFIGGLACNYAMMLSPVYPARAAFGVYSMYFISIFYSAEVVLDKMKGNWKDILYKGIVCTISLYFACSCIEACYDIGGTFWLNRQRIIKVEEEKGKGNYNITVPAFSPNTEYNCYFGLTDWPDYGVERYFGVDSIKVQ